MVFGHTGCCHCCDDDDGNDDDDEHASGAVLYCHCFLPHLIMTMMTRSFVGPLFAKHLKLDSNHPPPPLSSSSLSSSKRKDNVADAEDEEEEEDDPNMSGITGQGPNWLE